MKQFIHDYLKLPNVQFFLHHWIGCIFLMIILITCYVLVIIVENKQPHYLHSKSTSTKMRPTPVPAPRRKFNRESTPGPLPIPPKPTPRINLDRGEPTKPTKK